MRTRSALNKATDRQSSSPLATSSRYAEGSTQGHADSESPQVHVHVTSMNYLEVHLM